MACPFFEPTELVETGPWLHQPRLPLGETYTGLCHAHGAQQIEPAEHDLCNHGYARGRCEHFPADCQADAVRFSTIQEEPFRLIFIVEKEYAPLEHGIIEADAGAPAAILAAQARAFRSSYGRMSSQVQA